MNTAAIASGTSQVQDGMTEGHNEPEGVVQTRFGIVPSTADQQVRFQGGLPGFPGVECYQLEQVPYVEGDLMLLQSVEHVDVAFFVLPLAKDGTVITSADIDGICTQIKVKPEDLLLLTVVNLQRNGSELEKYVNLRAPICIDVQTQKGAQIVLNNPDYPLRLKLDT